ncbi:cytochrome c oxidase subunit II [Radicibacter daui]|uniref:cytochrome c oxidase subunit II n=1 Tax=Radicibacter daui TaxID=3064829 RepID=UPI004046D339
MKRFITASLAGLGTLMASAVALAEQPHEWGIGLQAARSPIKVEMEHFHTELLWIISAIVLLVMGLLAYVMVRFRAGRNPVPSKVTHNTLLEICWTGIPVLILVVIAIPSLKLLYLQDKQPDADMTIKVTGHQWYWSYEYADAAAGGGDADFGFDSYLIPDNEIDPAKGQIRLLSVDNEVIIPADTKVRFVITGADVIHSWAIPSLGIKMDAVPGRLNEAWTYVPAKYIGETFYGQCSEICGINHGFMPIAVRAVSREDYAKWLEQAKTKFASAAPSEAPGIGAVAQLAP